MTIDSDPSRSPDDPESRRFAELHALAGILPYHRRDELSALLSDADAATLRHLVETGMGANTLRALASDLAYLERWCLAATTKPLPWPAPLGLVVKFVAHHLYDPVKRETVTEHGMPEAVAASLKQQGALKVAGPHAPGTVKRRLSLWGTMHKWRGLAGPFGDGQIRNALRLAVRAAARPSQRKSQTAVTGDIIAKLLAACGRGNLADLRDAALLLTAFASGGRRRSEIAGLRVEDIVKEPDVLSDPLDPNSIPLPCRSLRLGRTKTTNASDDARSYLVGKPVLAQETWFKESKITHGPIFRTSTNGTTPGHRSTRRRQELPVGNFCDLFRSALRNWLTSIN